MEESIKIEIQDAGDYSNENVEFVSNVENIEYVNEESDSVSGSDASKQKNQKSNVKEEKDMTENKVVVENFENEKLEKIGVNDEEMDLFFILDRSGSMYSATTDTINGFNAFIEKQQCKNQNIFVTLILFDDGYEVLYHRVPIKEVKVLTNDEYYTRGCTALLDAVGRTVSSYNRESRKAMCVINTDGLENASREYTREQIKNMVETCGWEFIFIGADIDSYAEGSRIGIRRSRVANYRKTKDGINNMFCAVEKAADLHYENKFENLNENWKEDLE